MSDETKTAWQVMLKYKYTPSTDEIEQETDRATANLRADKLALDYLATCNKVTDMEHELAEMRRNQDNCRYLFTAAKRKYLELKLSAVTPPAAGEGPSTPQNADTKRKP